MLFPSNYDCFLSILMGCFHLFNDYSLLASLNVNDKIIFIFCILKSYQPTNIYTHGNKLGNTFSPWGKFEKIHFPFFWRY